MAQDQKKLLELVEDALQNSDRTGIKTLLENHRTSDIAEIVELLDSEEQRVVFDLLDRHSSAEVLEKVDEATRAGLFDILEDKEITDLISELAPDDAADLLAELPETESEELLEHMPPADAHQIKDLMGYSEDSAGGIMDPVLVSVREDATVGQAIDKIRSAQLEEDFFSVYVINKLGQFLGDIRILLLITRPQNCPIKQLIDTDTIYVTLDTDQEEVRNIFSKNDLIVVPVLDNDNRLVGRITADRVIEVAEEEAAEDMYAMAGTDAAELENISIVHAARVRMTWLLPCLAGTAITAIVALFFRTAFNSADLFVIYTTAFAFAPMIAAMSGNAGLQTSAIVVCGLATGDLAALKISQVFAREVRVAIVVAICCGLIGGVICGVLANIMDSETSPASLVRIAAAFGTAMFSAIMVATTLGLFLPFLFRKIGIDPAISSGPLVTTANDSISVTIYMTLTLLLIR